ncbi:hypothetical protein KI688_005069 [Linnemannia hyalina]|uniref:Tyrosine specific protein phosphatases domain-containing protein n=1 Tax=Linnemannia hyalina TaxID=64524 RepID=A0A9P7XLL9_9FUNG|nr:hypothetical protein KI688_005069 [Linnemannia hyalina]
MLEGSTPYSFAEMDLVLDRMDETAKKGQNVLAHCRGGVGRAAVVACCWLLRLRYFKDHREVIGWVRAQRSPKAIETVEQAHFVAGFQLWTKGGLDRSNSKAYETEIQRRINMSEAYMAKAREDAAAKNSRGHRADSPRQHHAQLYQQQHQQQQNHIHSSHQDYVRESPQPFVGHLLKDVTNLTQTSGKMHRNCVPSLRRTLDLCLGKMADACQLVALYPLIRLWYLTVDFETFQGATILNIGALSGLVLLNMVTIQLDDEGDVDLNRTGEPQPAMLSLGDTWTRRPGYLHLLSKLELPSRAVGLIRADAEGSDWTMKWMEWMEAT